MAKQLNNHPDDNHPKHDKQKLRSETGKLSVFQQITGLYRRVHTRGNSAYAFVGAMIGIVAFFISGFIGAMGIPGLVLALPTEVPNAYNNRLSDNQANLTAKSNIFQQVSFFVLIASFVVIVIVSI